MDPHLARDMHGLFGNLTRKHRTLLSGKSDITLPTTTAPSDGTNGCPFLPDAQQGLPPQSRGQPLGKLLGTDWLAIRRPATKSADYRSPVDERPEYIQQSG